MTELHWWILFTPWHHLCRLKNNISVIALCRDPSTRHLDGYKQMWTGRNIGGRVKKWRSKKSSKTTYIVIYALKVSVKINGVTCVFVVHFRSSDTLESVWIGLTVNIHVSTKTCVTGNNVILRKALFSIILCVFSGRSCRASVDVTTGSRPTTTWPSATWRWWTRTSTLRMSNYRWTQSCGARNTTDTTPRRK